jgi:hypothetical protein
MRDLQKERSVIFRGKGRAAHYLPGPELSHARARAARRRSEVGRAS